MIISLTVVSNEEYLGLLALGYCKVAQQGLAIEVAPQQSGLGLWYCAIECESDVVIALTSSWKSG